MSRSKKPTRNYRAEAALGDPRKIKTEEYKRSNHPDFATTNELKAMGYSGMRINSMAQQLEIWVKGVVRGTVAAPNGRPDEEAVQELFNTLFGMEK